MENNITILAERVGQLLKAHKLMLATAESCTGGQIAEAITQIAGSSQWFDRGFVTYSNAAKQEMLGVQKTTLEQAGAVSAETAAEMAEGAIHHSHAQVSVAVTGIAGPTGGSVDKPVGTIWLAFALPNKPTQSIIKHFKGNRQEIRIQTTIFALQQLLILLT